MQDLGRVFLSIQSLVEKATIYFDWSALMQTVAKVGFTRASKMHCVPTTVALNIICAQGEPGDVCCCPGQQQSQGTSRLEPKCI